MSSSSGSELNTIVENNIAKLENSISECKKAVSSCINRFFTAIVMVLTPLVAIPQFVIFEARLLLLIFGCAVLLSLGLNSFSQVVHLQKTELDNLKDIVEFRSLQVIRHPELLELQFYKDPDAIIKISEKSVHINNLQIVIINCSIFVFAFLWALVQSFSVFVLYWAFPLSLIIAGGIGYLHYLYAKRIVLKKNIASGNLQKSLEINEQNNIPPQQDKKIYEDTQPKKNYWS